MARTTKHLGDPAVKVSTAKVHICTCMCVRDRKEQSKLNSIMLNHLSSRDLEPILGTLGMSWEALDSMPAHLRTHTQTHAGAIRVANPFRDVFWEVEGNWRSLKKIRNKK